MCNGRRLQQSLCTFGRTPSHALNPPPMQYSVVLLVGAAVAFFVFHYASKLRHNIAAAKRSGLPYIVCRKFLTGGLDVYVKY